MKRLLSVFLFSIACAVHAQTEISGPFEQGIVDFSAKMKSLGFTISGESRAFYGKTEPRKVKVSVSYRQGLEVSYWSGSQGKLAKIKIAARKSDSFEKLKSLFDLDTWVAEEILDEKGAFTRYRKNGLVLDLNPLGVVTLYRNEKQE